MARKFPCRIKDETKQCGLCQEFKSFNLFSPVKSGQGGLASKCKLCTNEIYRKFLLKERMEITERKKIHKENRGI